jgi:hypothetical protein
MAYVEIRGVPIFLSRARLEIARESALSGWEISKRAASRIRSSVRRNRDAEDAEALIITWLEALADEAPEAFAAEWKTFRFVGDTANEELLHILSDYCERSGCSRVTSNAEGVVLRTRSQLALRVGFPPWHTIDVELVIAPSTILEIAGSLQVFTIWTSAFALECGSTIRLIPVVP